MARTLNEADLLALVDALADGGWVSGTALAEKAGISREALSKRMRKLTQDWQLDIEASRGRGYHLHQPLQRLSADGIRAELPTQWRECLEIRVVPRINSTNTALVQMPDSDAPQVLLADMQTAGRGRRGRSWVSPFGANLYLSMAWRFAAWPPQLTVLPLVVGVSCARALQGFGLQNIKLKWPNDLYVGNAKLGGILLEQRGEAGGPCRVVIGVGLNVAMARKQGGEVKRTWTTLETEFKKCERAVPQRNTLAAKFIAGLANTCEIFARNGFAPFSDDWHRLDLTRDRAVTVVESNAQWSGTARGINADGSLRVETGNGMCSVSAADVSLRVQQ